MEANCKHYEHPKGGDHHQEGQDNLAIKIVQCSKPSQAVAAKYLNTRVPQ